MGLDQYAYKKNGNEQVEIAYWRKHNALQGWMENLWVELSRPNQNDGDNCFNCVELQLEKEHLDRLERDVLNGELPETTGFFFGSDTSQDDYYKQKTLEFISEAREAIANGENVYYNSWW